jgi:hypothetical protein
VKKRCTAALLALCAAASLAAQQAPDTSALTLLDVNSYVSNFGFTKREIDRGEIDFTNDYALVGLDNDETTYFKFINLGKDLDMIDTPLEFALLSYYSQPVQNIRPVEAKNILPANNKTSELKLGAAVYQEMQMLRFLGNTDAVGRHEGIIRFITDRGNVSRAEVEKFYRDNIGASIAEVVDTEFNKVSFSITTNMSKSYNAVLTYNPKINEYILSYERPSVQNDDKEITAPNLNALIAEMRKNRTDFDERGIKAVEDNAARIPATIYAEWQTKGVANGVDALGLIKETLANFYVNPSDREAYNTLLEISARYRLMFGTRGDALAGNAIYSLEWTLAALSGEALVAKVNNDTARIDIRNTSNADRFRVFSTSVTQR